MKLLKIKKSYSVTFSPDGTLLATMGRYVSVWDVAKGRKKFRCNPLRHPSHLCFSPSGKQLAVKGTSGHIFIIDSETGEAVSDFMNLEDGEGANPQYSSCGEYLVDGSWNGRLFVRRASTGGIEFAQDFPGEMITRIHSAKEGQLWVVEHSPVATTSNLPLAPDYFSLWSWPFRVNSCLFFPRRISFVRLSAVTRDGSLLAVVHGTPPVTLAVYRMSDGTEAGSVSIEAGGMGNGLSWSPDGRYIGLAQSKGAVVYEADKLKPVRDFSVPYASDIAFATQGNLLAIGSWQAGLVISLDE